MMIAPATSRLCVATIATIAFALAGSPVRAQSVPELKLSAAVGSAYALGKAADRWAKRIGEASGGRLAVKVHAGAALAQRDPSREFAALAGGAADLAVGSTLAWSSTVRELGVVGLPWLASSPRQLAALFDGDVGLALAAAVERGGAVPVAFAPLGFRALATRERAIENPSELAGMRVRILAPPPVADVYAALGAVPRTTSFAEAEAALAAGTLDAQDGTLAAFGAARVYSIGFKRVLLWDATAEGAIFAVNRKRWDSWTDEERAVVRDAARDAARELPALVQQDDEAALQELAKGGVTITRVTPTGRGAFVAATRGVYEQWSSAAGADLARRAEAAVAAAPP